MVDKYQYCFTGTEHNSEFNVKCVACFEIDTSMVLYEYTKKYT